MFISCDRLISRTHFIFINGRDTRSAHSLIWTLPASAKVSKDRNGNLSKQLDYKNGSLYHHPKIFTCFWSINIQCFFIDFLKCPLTYICKKRLPVILKTFILSGDSLWPKLNEKILLLHF